MHWNNNKYYLYTFIIATYILSKGLILRAFTQGPLCNCHADLGHWSRRKEQHDFRLSSPYFTQNSDLITRSCFFTKENSFSSSFIISIWTEVTLLYFFVSCSSCSFITEAVLKIKHQVSQRWKQVQSIPVYNCVLYMPPSLQTEAAARMLSFH